MYEGSTRKCGHANSICALNNITYMFVFDKFKGMVDVKSQANTYISIHANVCPDLGHQGRIRFITAEFMSL